MVFVILLPSLESLSPDKCSRCSPAVVHLGRGRRNSGLPLRVHAKL